MTTRQRVLRDTLTRIQRLLVETDGTLLDGVTIAGLESILAEALASTLPDEQSETFTTRDVTILLADLRGFSMISEAYPTRTILELLRPYFATMTEIIVGHMGTIDKFMGDSVMALFGEERADGSARRAVVCAVDMQLAMDKLNRECRERGLPELHMGIGITSGPVMAGLIGSGARAEYAVIGGEVNLASRIEAFALRGQVLVSQSAFERCGDFVLTDKPIEVHVKGRSSPVVLREVIGIPSLGREVPRKEIRRSLRVKVELPLIYRRVRNKIVDSEPQVGRIVDIGYFGVKAELSHALDTYAELKMEIDLSIVGHVVGDIYARIVRLRPGGNGFVASIEFTSLSDKSQALIRRFVQLMV